MKINKIITLSMLFLANSAFAMEQNNFGKEDPMEIEEYKQIVSENNFNILESLLTEIMEMILQYCSNDMESKYPKFDNALKLIEQFKQSKKISSENLKNIRAVNKHLYYITNDFIERLLNNFNTKDIQDQFKKYDRINKPLFDELLLYKINFKLVLNSIKNGADVNLQDEDGNTALMWAVSSAYTEAVKALIAANADVNLQNIYGETALMWAASKGDTEIVKVLIAAGADLNLQNNSGSTALIWATRCGANFNLQKKKGDTALMWAILNGYINAVKALIAANADLNKQAKDGNTALDIAQKSNYQDISKVLIEAGAIQKKSCIII